MKQIILILFIVLLCSSLFSQDNKLTENQKREYNQKRISIEPYGEYYSTVGYFNSYQAVSYKKWVAIKGLNTKLKEYEFFKLTGYLNEAIKSKQHIDSGTRMIQIGSVSFLIGSALMCYPIIKQNNVDVSIYYFGGALNLIGLIELYRGYLRLNKNYASYQVATDIANSYNKKLLKAIQIK